MVKRIPVEQTPGEWDVDRDPVERLAEEFAERCRQGEPPDIEQYAARDPQLAAEIRDLFPTIAAMERVHGDGAPCVEPVAAAAPSCPEQLGDFRVLTEIGRGGMGVVYEAEQVTLGRRVAVKVLSAHSLRSPKEIHRFRREAQTAARLHHTNIVPVFGAGEQGGVHFIVMQLIQGVGLDEILSELRRISGQACEPALADGPTARHRSTRVKQNVAALLHAELRLTASSSSLADSHSDSPVRSDSEDRTSAAGTAIDRTSAAQLDPACSPDAAPAAEPATRVTTQAAGLCGDRYWRNVARIGMQVASALHYAHSHGTLHRDIKPGNLLLDDEGVVWVADFGLAKATEQDQVTWTGDLVGTLTYMAPERFDGQADQRSDIYGLGLTLYELLTLRRCFEPGDRAQLIRRLTTTELLPPRRINSDIPCDLETITLKATACDPADRYQSAEDLAHDLQCFLEDRPIAARRASPWERLVRWSRRNRVVAGLAATIVALLVLTTAIASLGYVRETVQRRRVESTARLAVDALEDIYSQFAPASVQSLTHTSLEEGDETQLLAASAQLPLSKDVAVLLENLLDYYDRLSNQVNSDPEVWLKSITAARRVGDIHHRLGQPAKAQQAYERAIARDQQAAPFVQDPAGAALELAHIYNGLGTVLSEQRQGDAARQAHERALRVLESTRGDSQRSRYELARTLYLLHLVDRRSPWGPPRGARPAAAEMALERAIDLLESAEAQSPTAPEGRFLLARCYLGRGFARSRPGVPPATDDHQHAIRILESLVAEFPTTPDYRYELGNAYAELGFAAMRGPAAGVSHASEQPGIEQHLRHALEVTQDLELNYPNIPKYLMQQTRLHDTLGLTLRRSGRLQEAEQQYREALQIQRRVVLNAIDPWRHEVWQGQCQLSLAEVLREMNRLDESRSELTSLVTRLEQLGSDSTSADPFSTRLATRTLERARRTLSQLPRPPSDGRDPAAPVVDANSG